MDIGLGPLGIPGQPEVTHKMFVPAEASAPKTVPSTTIEIVRPLFDFFCLTSQSYRTYHDFTLILLPFAQFYFCYSFTFDTSPGEFLCRPSEEGGVVWLRLAAGGRGIQRK